jgi:hypothetical protein
MPVFRLQNPKYNNDDTIIVRCDCHSTEHELSIIPLYDWDDIGTMFYSINVHLATYDNFFKRIWLAIRYVFGYKSKYGHFEEILITDSDVVELGKFFTKHERKA